MAIIDSFQKQRLSYSEKISKDHKWAKDMVDSLTMNHGEWTSTNFPSSTQTDYFRKLSNYQLFNNVLNQEDFEKECNPFGINVGQFKDEIKPYNKIPNKINASKYDRSPAIVGPIIPAALTEVNIKPKFTANSFCPK